MPSKQLSPLLFRQLWTQTLALLLVAACLAAAANLLRPNPLPWIKVRAAAVAIPADELLTAAQALPLAALPEVLFVDAREADEFGKQRIRGAVNLPYDPFGNELDTATLPRDKTLVVYCGAEGCPLSEELAQALKAAGFGRVKVLKGGLKAWLAAGGPAEGQ